MDVLGTSTRDFTPAGQRRYQKNSNPWPASIAPPTNSSTLMDTDAPTDTSSIHEEDNDDQDATGEVKGKSLRNQFLKTPTNKPAPAKTNAGQSVAPNMTNTKTNGATASPPSTAPMAAASPSAAGASMNLDDQDNEDGHNTPATPSKRHYRLRITDTSLFQGI